MKPPTKPEVSKVLLAAKHYSDQEENWNGGSLHLVLADGNLDTHCIEFDLSMAIKNNDGPAIAIALLLLLMTGSQRRRLYRRLKHERRQEALQEVRTAWSFPLRSPDPTRMDLLGFSR